MDRPAKLSGDRARAPEAGRLPAATSAGLSDHSARGERMHALARLARAGPAATAQRQRLQSLFGAAAVAQLQKLTPLTGAGFGAWQRLKAAVVTFNTLPEVTHRDEGAFRAQTAALATVKAAITDYGKSSTQVDTLNGEIIGIEGDLEDKLWGSVRPRAGRPGDKPEVADKEGVREGSASDVKEFAHLKKNPRWEIVFRLLSKVAPGAFDVARENDVMLEASKAAISIPTSTSNDVIAVSRNPEFALGPLLADDKAWVNKLCYAAVLPANYGVDLEAEYFDYLAWRRAKGDPLPAQEAVVRDRKKAAREIDVMRMPSTLVLGWAYRDGQRMVYEENSGFKGPTEKELGRDRFDTWINLIYQKSVELKFGKEYADFDSVEAESWGEEPRGVEPRAPKPESKEQKKEGV